MSRTSVSSGPDVSTRLAASFTKPPVIPAPKPGVYENVPMDVYHAWDAASNSRLGQLRRSPAHLQAYIAQPPKDTTAQIVGRAVHTAILEPHAFDERFVIAEQCTAIKKDGAPCTNTGTGLYADGWRCGVHNKGIGEADGSKIVLSPDYHAVCLGTRKSVFAHTSAAAMLETDGRNELSIVWIDKETGVPCKARLDRHVPTISTGLITDLKSTVNATKFAFERSIDSYGYHLQGAHYLTGAQAVGLEAHHFVNVAFEKEAPFAVATYRIVEAAIDAGDKLLRQLLRTYAKCLETGKWPAYPQDVQDIGLPTYAWQKADDELREMATMGTDYEAVG